MRLIPQVAALLRAAAAAEHTARGSERRRAFATTRYLIAAALNAGVSSAEIADLLSVTPASVVTRGSTDGSVDAVTLSELTGFSARRLARWERAGLLRPEYDARGTTYAATDIVNALVTMSVRRTSAGSA